MSAGKLAGKRVLMVIPHTQFRDEEFFDPKKILEAEGAVTVTASSAARTCYSVRGAVVQSECAIADAKPDEFDALVLCGGASVPEFFWKDKKLQDLAAAMSAAGKLVAAISLSTVVLAKAKLLAGRKATVYFLPEAIQELKASGATYVSEPVVVQDKIITAEGPRESVRFGEAIRAAMSG